MSVKLQMLSKAGLEVYTTEPVEVQTKEENTKKDTNDSEDSEDSKDKTEETSTEDETSLDSSTNFILQNGATKQIDYIGELFSDSFEMDYTDISSNSSVSVPIEYMKHFFKGKKMALKKAWQTGPLEWEKMNTAVLGFCTELTWNNDHIDVKISGMDKLMEQSATFEFTQTKRSEIVTQIIEKAGLKAKVDVTGLVDDVIDFKTSSSSSSTDSGSSDLPGIGNKTIDDLVKEIVGSESDELAKAKKIHEWLRKNVIYSFYECTRYSTPESCLKNKSHLNCADTARLTTAMMKSAGLTAYVVHGPYHFWTMIEIGGKKYASDQTGRESAGMSGSAFNTVWWQGRGRSSAIPPYSKNGDNPSC